MLKIKDKTIMPWIFALLFTIIFFFYLNFVMADIISFNDGGSNELCINSGGGIEDCIFRMPEGIISQIAESEDYIWDKDNPKYFNIIYPENWLQGSEVIIQLKVYDRENKIYSPKNISLKFDSGGLMIKNITFINNTGTIITLFLDKKIILGEHKLSISVIDESTISDTIKLNIVEKKPSIKENKNWTIFYIIAIIILILLIASIIVIDRIRIWKKKKNI
jgi:hypothetical protein